MGAKLTAGVLAGALVVVGGSAYVAVGILGSHTGSGDAAAGRAAAAHSTDVARWLTPPDDGKYSGTQLVAAALAAHSSGSAVLTIAASEDESGTLTAVPVAWSGSTAATGGARVTVRIDAHLVARSAGLFGTQSTAGGSGERCYVYTVLGGEVAAVRSIRCPPDAEAMKLPEPAALPAAKAST